MRFIARTFSNVACSLGLYFVCKPHTGLYLKI